MCIVTRGGMKNVTENQVILTHNFDLVLWDTNLFNVN